MSKLSLVGKKLVGATFYQKENKLVLFTENEAVEISCVDICRDGEAVLGEEITGLSVELAFEKITIRFYFENKNFLIKCYKNFSFNPPVSYSLRIIKNHANFTGMIARSSDSSKVMILGNNIYLPRVVHEETLARLAEDYSDVDIAFMDGCVRSDLIDKYFAPRDGDTEIWI